MKLTLALIAALAASSTQAAFCLEEFSEILKSRLKHFSPKINAHLAGEGAQEFIDGHLARRFIPPRGHDRGRLHAGLLVYEKKGVQRLVKILRPGDYPHPSMLDDELRGVLIGQQLQGPRLYRHGHIRLSSGKERPYIEMELLFPGQEHWNYRGLPPEQSSLLLKGENPPLRQMAKIFVDAIEHRVIPGPEVDFLFTDSRVRLIDTGNWQSTDAFKLDQIRPIRDFMINLENKHSGLGAVFLQYFSEAILTSQELSGPYQRLFLDRLKKSNL